MKESFYSFSFKTFLLFISHASSDSTNWSTLSTLLQFYLHFSLGGSWLSVITRKKHMKATFFAIYNHAVYFLHSFCISSFSMLLRDMLYIFFFFLSSFFFLLSFSLRQPWFPLSVGGKTQCWWRMDLRAKTDWRCTGTLKDAYFLGYFILKIPRLRWLCPLFKKEPYSLTIFLLRAVLKNLWKVKCNIAIFERTGFFSEQRTHMGIVLERLWISDKLLVIQGALVQCSPLNVPLMHN